MTREQRREQIVEAAASLFAERGVDETSVSDIVRTLGVAQGTFYWYFPSKDDVVNAVVERFSEAMCADVAAIASDPGIGAVEKLTRIQDALLTPTWRERGVLEHVHREEHREFHDRIERETTRLLVAPLRRVIEQGVAEGTFATEEPALAATMVAAMAGGLDELLDLGQVDLERTKASLMAFVLRGLGASG